MQENANVGQICNHKFPQYGDICENMQIICIYMSKYVQKYAKIWTQYGLNMQKYAQEFAEICMQYAFMCSWSANVFKKCANNYAYICKTE